MNQNAEKLPGFILPCLPFLGVGRIIKIGKYWDYALAVRSLEGAVNKDGIS
jgi:hypothetical protein